MIHILIPLAGKSLFFQDPLFHFPKPLIEIDGVPMIQRVIKNLQSIKADKKFIFVLDAIDCTKFHLDDVVRLLVEEPCEVILLHGETRGAACSALFAIEQINNDAELIIANADQIIHADLNDIIQNFQKRELDAAVICFDSVHPRWSFVQVDDDGAIVGLSIYC